MKSRNLFVIGDSISIQYGPYLREMLEGRIGYDRKRGEDQSLDLPDLKGANGGDSKMVLEYLYEEVKKGKKYDMLMINCGLHDVKVDENNKLQVDPIEYEGNLERIVKLAKGNSKDVIWVRTTPVDDEIHNQKASFKRYNKDVIAYNSIADEMMKRHSIPIIDLFSFTNHFNEEVYCDHVHFVTRIRELQAAYIAGYMARYSSS